MVSTLNRVTLERYFRRKINMYSTSRMTCIPRTVPIGKLLETSANSLFGEYAEFANDLGDKFQECSCVWECRMNGVCLAEEINTPVRSAFESFVRKVMVAGNFQLIVETFSSAFLWDIHLKV